jgi:hypothetical protein
MASDDLPPDLDDLGSLFLRKAATAPAAVAAVSAPAVQTSGELLNAGRETIAPQLAARLQLKGGAGAPAPAASPKKTDAPESLAEVIMQTALGERAKDAAQAAKSSFGKGSALKAGFLSGGSGKKSSGASSARAGASASVLSPSYSSASKPWAGGEEDIIEVRTNGNARDSLRFAAVQEALNATTAPAMKEKLGSGQWITPALLERVAKEPRLLAGMANERYMAALSEIMAAPQAGMAKYASDEGLSTFLRAFMALMADHFTTLGEEEARGGKERASAEAEAAPALTPVSSRSTKPSAGGSLRPDGTLLGDRSLSSAAVAEAMRAAPDADEAVRKALGDVAVIDVLRDPKVQAVLEACRVDGRHLGVALREPGMRAKLLVLQRAGLIRFE